MAIGAPPKKSPHYRKARASHHRHNKSYVKTYWPYLPMLAIMGGGVLLDRSWHVATSGIAGGQAGSTASAAFSGLSTGLQPASRLASLAGSQAAWLSTAVLLLAVAALAFFMIQNSRRLHKVVVKSEHYFSDHPFFDIAAVFIFTAGFVLLR